MSALDSTSSRLIVLHEPYSGHISDDFLEKVLAFLPDNTTTPWVTWLYNKQTDGLVDGHYFERLYPALSDYIERYRKGCPPLNKATSEAVFPAQMLARLIHLQNAREDEELLAKLVARLGEETEHLQVLLDDYNANKTD